MQYEWQIIYVSPVELLYFSVVTEATTYIYKNNMSMGIYSRILTINLKCTFSLHKLSSAIVRPNAGHFTISISQELGIFSPRFKPTFPFSPPDMNVCPRLRAGGVWQLSRWHVVPTPPGLGSGGADILCQSVLWVCVSPHRFVFVNINKMCLPDLSVILPHENVNTMVWRLMLIVSVFVFLQRRLWTKAEIWFILF